jgi:hypothetical protein
MFTEMKIYRWLSDKDFVPDESALKVNKILIDRETI